MNAVAVLTFRYMSDYDNDASHDTSSHDNDNSAHNNAAYTMTPEEAVIEFDQAQLPISLRTAQRYCSRDKLDCLKIDPETREATENKTHFNYLINPSSLEIQFKRMREKREMEQRQRTARHDVPRPDSASHSSDADMRINQNMNEIEHDATPPRPDVGDDATRHVELEKEVVELRKQLFDAEVEKRAAHQVRDIMTTEFQKMQASMNDVQYRLGDAEAQLRALKAPADIEGRG